MQEEVELRACMQIAGGWMECRGSAGAGEGQVHAGTLAALVSGCALGALSSVQCGRGRTGSSRYLWTCQGLPIPCGWRPGRSSAPQSWLCRLATVSQVSSQPRWSGQGGGKGYNHWSGAQGVQMGVWPVFCAWHDTVLPDFDFLKSCTLVVTCRPHLNEMSNIGTKHSF